MPKTIRIPIPPNVALLLSRQALNEYSLACEAALLAADHCGVSDAPSPDALAHLRTCRVRVIAAEEALKLVAGADGTAAACTLSVDGADRDLVGALAGTTLDRLSAGLEASEEEILAAADSIRRLRALLDELGISRERPAAQDREVRPARPSGRGDGHLTIVG